MKIRERDLAQWATDRKRAGQLYDKNVFVIVQNQKSFERLENEPGHDLDILMSDDADNLRENLEYCFRRSAKGGKEQILPAPATNEAELPAKAQGNRLNNGIYLILLEILNFVFRNLFNKSK